MLSCSPHMSKVHELQIRYINFLFCKSGSAPSPFSSFPFVTVFNFILLFQYHHYCRRRWLRGLVVIHPRPWLQAKAASNCLFIAITIHCDDDHHNHNHNHHSLSLWSCFEPYATDLFCLCYMCNCAFHNYNHLIIMHNVSIDIYSIHSSETAFHAVVNLKIFPFLDSTFTS